MSSLNIWTVFVILLLLSEVLSPKDHPIKASPQALRYFNPGSQAVLQRMLFDWARVQRSAAVGRCEDHEDDVKRYQ